MGVIRAYNFCSKTGAVRSVGYRFSHGAKILANMARLTGLLKQLNEAEPDSAVLPSDRGVRRG